MAITFTAGMKLTPARLNALVPLHVRKTADETVSASTTKQNDDHLFVAVEANAVYEFTAFLMVVHSTDAADISVDWTFPSGATVHYGGAGPHNGALTGSGSNGSGEWIARQNQTSSPTTATPYAGSTVPVDTILKGLLITSSAGTFQLRWSQNTATGTTTLKAGSYLKLDRTA